MKKYKIIMLVILILFFVWIFALLKCEILTLKYGAEFDNIDYINEMLGDVKYLKVLNYSDKNVQVYYLSANYSAGNTITFVRKNNTWECTNWNTVWSITGSADEVIWPYLWHFFYAHMKI